MYKRKIRRPEYLVEYTREHQSTELVNLHIVLLQFGKTFDLQVLLKGQTVEGERKLVEEFTKCVHDSFLAGCEQGKASMRKNIRGILGL